MRRAAGFASKAPLQSGQTQRYASPRGPSATSRRRSLESYAKGFLTGIMNHWTDPCYGVFRQERFNYFF
jgi:hypothetical protein